MKFFAEVHGKVSTEDEAGWSKNRRVNWSRACQGAKGNQRWVILAQRRNLLEALTVGGRIVECRTWKGKVTKKETSSILACTVTGKKGVGSGKGQNNRQENLYLLGVHQ